MKPYINSKLDMVCRLLFLRVHFQLLIAISLAFQINHAFAEDLLIGKFSSETRENFGTEKPSEVEVYVYRKKDKYIVTVFHQGKYKYDFESIKCSPKNEGYLIDRPSGNVDALCNGNNGGEAFIYSENGIKDPMERLYASKGLKNPRVPPYYKAQYYGFIQSSFYAFRKVDSFQFAPNDADKLTNRETPEFIALCKTAGVKLMEKPVAPVRSIAYGWDSKRLKGSPDFYRYDLDSDPYIRNWWV